MLNNFYRYSAFTRIVRLFLAGALVLSPISTAQAYDSTTHDKMTDVAYEIMLVVANYRNVGAVPTNLAINLKRLEAQVPGLHQFLSDIGKAVTTLQKLPSALPTPSKDALCSSPETVMKLGTNNPDWNIPSNGTLADVPMKQVAFPVTVDYSGTGDCNIDANWQPGGGGIFNISNKDGADRTGNILGFWAQHPDQEADDWHMYSPFGSSLNTVKTFTEAGLAAGASAAVSCACAFICVVDPFACATCVTLTSEAAISIVTSVGNLPDFTDWTSNDLYTGLGHHIDMKPPSPEGVPAFDDSHGFFAGDPGPFHVSDSFETLINAGTDAIGLRVKFDPSLGPKNYQIELPGTGDFDPNSVPRVLNDWEAQTLPHIQFTPVDNLGLFGWEEFEALAGVGSFAAPGVAKNLSQAAWRLGWPLHAIGDATVPMHVTNTVGWGHRPYEDAVDFMIVPQTQSNIPPLLREDDENAQTAIVVATLLEALKFRQMVIDWRLAHPNLTHEVPVRDLVTAVASSTFQKSMAKANTIFNPNASLDYMFAKGATTQAFENPQIATIAHDLLLDGIAAEIAFLTSAMEVLP